MDLIKYKTLFNKLINTIQQFTKRDVNQRAIQQKLQQYLHESPVKNMTLEHLLSYLTFMYSAHGISYDVTNLHETILRMLTPMQVLTHFNCYNPTYMLQQSKFYEKLGQNNQRDQRKQAQQIVNSKAKNHSQNGYFSNSKQIFKQVMKQKAKIDIKQDDRLRKKDRHTRRKSTYRVYNGGKPILSPQQQNKVKIFMENEVQKGNILTMSKIAREAKKIAKNSQYFLGSQGWVKNFLKRHQDMRQLYNKSRDIKAQKNRKNIQTKPKAQYQFSDQQDNQKDYQNSYPQNSQYLSKQPNKESKNQITMLCDMLHISQEKIRQQYEQFKNQNRNENQYEIQSQQVSQQNQDQDQYYYENSDNSINQQENK